MASGARTSLLDIFLLLFFLLSLHLGCCFSPSRSQDDPDRSAVRRGERFLLFPLPSRVRPDSDSDSGDARPDRNGGLGLGLSLTSVRSYLRRFFSVPKRGGREDIRSPPVDLSPCPAVPASRPTNPLRPGRQASRRPTALPSGYEAHVVRVPRGRLRLLGVRRGADEAPPPGAPPGHEALLSELSDADSGKNIVRIIFLSGWKGRAPPTVRRILKVHNTQRTLARFEEYRDLVRSRAARRAAARNSSAASPTGTSAALLLLDDAVLAGAGVREPLLLHLRDRAPRLAGKQADLDGIATHASSWAPRLAARRPGREFAYLRARRAMLVCRVVRAGGAQRERERERGRATGSRGEGGGRGVRLGGGGGRAAVGVQSQGCAAVLRNCLLGMSASTSASASASTSTS
ncbi:hypothetical protein ACMD2_21502 [Ananas comosus]|uniref:Uncharacterized protein n=1 Tax=Ananas comosus TaxID=4615 RepID=A0A199VB05_ANACO|nr:hypothetical protein ACMD2_21502 [Ananas comosus]